MKNRGGIMRKQPKWYYYLVWIEHYVSEPVPLLRLATSKRLAEKGVREETQRCFLPNTILPPGYKLNKILGSLRLDWPGRKGEKL